MLTMLQERHKEIIKLETELALLTHQTAANGSQGDMAWHCMAAALFWGNSWSYVLFHRAILSLCMHLQSLFRSLDWRQHD